MQQKFHNTKLLGPWTKNFLVAGASIIRSHVPRELYLLTYLIQLNKRISISSPDFLAMASDLWCLCELVHCESESNLNAM